MRRALRRGSAACLLVAVVAQAGSARLASCSSNASDHSGLEDPHAAVAFQFGHARTPATDLTPSGIAVFAGGNRSSESSDAGSCVTNTHCGFNPGALESPPLSLELENVALEGTGPAWFVHTTATHHATPPPRA